MTRSRLYRGGALVSEDFPPAELETHLDDQDAMVWLDLDDVSEISGKLGLHELAVEDALQEHQRPKLDTYHQHLFITTYAAQTDGIDLRTLELAVFVTDRVLITVRKDKRFDIDAVVTRWDARTDLAKFGVGFLLHGLLDYVVDGYLDALEVLDDHVEELEDTVFTDKPLTPAMQRRSLRLHKSLGRLRRKAVPMRDVVSQLLRREEHAMLPYFQDIQDHVLWAAEQLESLRELLDTIRDTQLNLQGNRLNLIMKKVTGWAAIIAVPTAITGFYGQNVPYPGFDAPIGFWTSTLVIVLLSIGLYSMFKRRDWL
jgi:magnesium transporter